MVMLEFNTLNDALIASAKTDQGIWFVTGFDEETFFSYAELLDNAKAYLAALQKYGVKPGDELVLQYSSLQQLIEAQWACLLGGIVPIPLEKGDKPDSGLKVLQVWQQLLGHSQISRQVSYFDVGGNSFSLMLMHNELDQIWPGLIQVTDIFARVKSQRHSSTVFPVPPEADRPTEQDCLFLVRHHSNPASVQHNRFDFQLIIDDSDTQSLALRVAFNHQRLSQQPVFRLINDYIRLSKAIIAASLEGVTS